MNHSFPVSTGRTCVGSALLLCMLLVGCQMPPPLHRGLTQTQVTALKSAGFQETGEGFEFGSTGPILFDFDRYNLKPDVRRIVERIGRTLRSAGINGVRVYGYSDDEGTAAYDAELSRRRAEVVAVELVDVGLDAKRIAIVGKGKLDPVGDNRTPAGRAQNRRAAIVVSPR
ncbi:peptidoglycan-binding protein ArfA [Burkholderia cenocepacia]|uniref:OmpA family protein n=1 Tax=Burkholderia cenocepacia TaxID=95486 RepID=UPI0003C4D21F|nr:OmpA family protein [Burkholderia cenocepacia]ESS40201.1 Integral membrane protein YfiB [Burkholderia cenocepacia KC-01]MBR8306901.1 OmpA family protein [Burkholderia cenocepacia]MDR8074824.1 OmpA family protein [Burkholderia cenocepacia]QND97307.1 peptidoglycan-binding protein ArfA [Burkholderia cenocepacia]RQU98932.1 OmpA family protein [Burkholderia cenocepacia]